MSGVGRTNRQERRAARQAERAERDGGLLKQLGENIAETGKDLSTKAGVKLGLKDKPSCGIKGGPGNAKADIDYSDLPPNAKLTAETQANAAAEHILTLEGQLEAANAAGNGAEAASIAKDIEAAKEALDEFKFQIETSGAEIGASLALGIAFPPLGIILGLVQAGTDQRADMDKVNEAGDQLQFDSPEITITDDLAPQPQLDIDNAVGQMPLAEIQTPQDMMAEATKGMDAGKTDGGVGSTDGTNSTENSNSTEGTSDKEAAKEAANKKGADLIGQGGGAIRDAMKNDPEGFAKMLTEMDPNLAGAMMNEMQSHMQAVNRAWSSISNLEKAEHDTQKAIISNLRV